MDKLIFVYIVATTICIKDIWCKHRTYHENGRIVGGNNTTIQMYPYQAYLLLYDGHDYYQCGGTIVSKRAIVTAAHCLSRIQKIYVRIGSTNASSGGTQYETTKFVSHPWYNKATSDYDAGVVRLSKDMNLDGTNARSIRLVDSGYDPNEGVNMTLTGWGTTTENGSTSSTLMAVQVPVVARNRCNQQLGGGGITSRMFCAGLLQGGKDTCQGDSGGPAVIKSDRLAGITSFGYGCARPNSPGVYTLVGNMVVRLFLNQYIN